MANESEKTAAAGSGTPATPAAPAAAVESDELAKARARIKELEGERTTLEKRATDAEGEVTKVRGESQKLVDTLVEKGLVKPAAKETDGTKAADEVAKSQNGNGAKPDALKEIKSTFARPMSPIRGSK